MELMLQSAPSQCQKRHPLHVQCPYIHRLLQSTIYPCNSNNRGNSNPEEFFYYYYFIIKDPQNPHRQWAHPFKEGILVAFAAYPQNTICFHIVLNLQENQRLVAHHRTQPLQYTVLLNLHQRTQPLQNCSKLTSEDTV